MQTKSMIRFKVIAMTVVVAFLFEQIIYAAPSLPSSIAGQSLQKPLNLNLSREIAHIDESFEGLVSNPRLILIQDAHTNVSGQLNIAETLSNLVSAHSVKYVFTEAGMGDNSLTFLRNSAPEKIRKQIGLEYLRKGKLKGTEFLSLSSDLDFTIWGVEDPDLYSNSFDAYKQIVNHRNVTVPQLRTLISNSQYLKDKIYNYELRDFDVLRIDYQHEKVTVSEYIDRIGSYLTEEEVQAFPTFYQLKQLQTIERTIQFEKSEIERRAFLSRFEMEWKAVTEDINPTTALTSPLEAMRSKEREWSYQHFKGLVDSLMVSKRITSEWMSDEYPNLNQYIHYADKAFALDMRAVVDEIEKVESFAAEKLTHTDEERDLLYADRMLRSYQKLIEMKATPSEYQIMKSAGEYAGYVRTVGILNRLLMEQSAGYEKTSFLNTALQDSIESSLKFYQLAGSRDQIFIRETLEKLRSEKHAIGVLVTGGFHTPNLTQILRANQISYISIQPQVSHETDHGRYERMLLNQDVSSSWKQRILAKSTTNANGNILTMDLLNVVVGDPVGLTQLRTALGVSASPVNLGSANGSSKASRSESSESSDPWKMRSMVVAASRLAGKLSQWVRAVSAKYFQRNLESLLIWLKNSKSTSQDQSEKVAHVSTQLREAIHKEYHANDSVNDLNRITIDSSVDSTLFASGISQESLRYVFSEVLKNAFDEPVSGKIRISAETSENRIAINIDNDGEMDWVALWFSFLNKLTNQRLYVDTETQEYRAVLEKKNVRSTEVSIGIADLFVLRNIHRLSNYIRREDGQLKFDGSGQGSLDPEELEGDFVNGRIESDLSKKLIATLSSQQISEYFEGIDFKVLNAAAIGRMWKSPDSNSLIIASDQPDQEEYIPYSLSSFMVDHAESLPEIRVLPLIQKVTRADTPVKEKEGIKQYGGLGNGLFVSLRLLVAAGGDLQIVPGLKGGTRTKIILNKTIESSLIPFEHRNYKKIKVNFSSSEKSGFIFQNEASVQQFFNLWPSNSFQVNVQADDQQSLSIRLKDEESDEMAIRILFDTESKTAFIDFFTAQGPVVGNEIGVDAQILPMNGMKRAQVRTFLVDHFFPRLVKSLNEVNQTQDENFTINELRISHGKNLINPIDFADGFFMEDSETGDLVFRAGFSQKGARLSDDGIRIPQIYKEENIEVPLLKGEELNVRLDQTTVVIMAGGKGTRLREILKADGHKPILKIDDLSLLDRTIRGLKILGVRKVVIVHPEKIDRNAWPRSDKTMQIDLVPKGDSDYHTSVLNAVAYVKDQHQSNQVMVLSGDNLFHLKSAAEALYGENTRAVMIGENPGDRGLQVKTNRFGLVKSYQVDYAGEGPYPIGWFIPIADYEALAEATEPSDTSIRGLERLLAENNTSFNAPRANYDPTLNNSFNMNKPQDYENLKNALSSDSKPYGDTHALHRGSAVYKTIDRVNQGNALWAKEKNRIRGIGFRNTLHQIGIIGLAAFSIISWVMIGLLFSETAFTQVLGLSDDSLITTPLYYFFSFLFTIPSFMLAIYTILNTYIGFRILGTYQKPQALEMLDDVELPSLSIVVPIKNEPPAVILRTLKSAYESGYPAEKLQILLVSGYAEGERNDAYHDQYSQMIEDINPEGNVISLVEVQMNEGVVNGKAVNLNHVLFNQGDDLSRSISGDFTSIADADSYFAPGDLRAAASAAMRQRGESSVEVGIIQFKRQVDVGSDTDYGHFFTTMRQILHDIVLDDFVTPLRFNSGFIGNFGHGNFILTRAAREVGGFNENQKIEDIDIALKMRQTGYRVLYNNSVSLSEGITLGGTGFFKRAGKIARGDMNLLQAWKEDILFSNKFNLEEKGHTLIHLARGLSTFALMFASVMLPLFIYFGTPIYISDTTYALITGILYLTVFPSIYFIHSQPIIVAPVIIRLLLKGEFRQAIDVFLVYPMEYIYLLGTNPLMGLTSLKVALTGKLEKFIPIEKSTSEEPAVTPSRNLSVDALNFIIEKSSLIFSITMIFTAISLLPVALQMAVGTVLLTYFTMSGIYHSYFREHFMRPKDSSENLGARLAGQLQPNQYDQGIIEARRERIVNFLREHITDPVSKSWYTYISDQLRTGKKSEIPSYTIKNDLKQIGRTQPEVVVEIAKIGIAHAFQQMKEFENFVIDLSADAMSEPFLAMFQLEENKEAILKQLRPYIRQVIGGVYSEVTADSNIYQLKPSAKKGSRLTVEAEVVDEVMRQIQGSIPLTKIRDLRTQFEAEHPELLPPLDDEIVRLFRNTFPTASFPQATEVAGSRLSHNVAQRYSEAVRQVTALMREVNTLENPTIEQLQEKTLDLLELFKTYDEFSTLFGISLQEISDKGLDLIGVGDAHKIRRNGALGTLEGPLSPRLKEWIARANTEEIANQNRIIRGLENNVGIVHTLDGKYDPEKTPDIVNLVVERSRVQRVYSDNVYVVQNYLYLHKLEIERVKRYIRTLLDLERPVPFGVRVGKGRQTIVYDGNHRSYLEHEYALRGDQVHPETYVLTLVDRKDIDRLVDREWNKPSFAGFRTFYEDYDQIRLSSPTDWRGVRALKEGSYDLLDQASDGRYFLYNLRYRVPAIINTILYSALPNLDKSGVKDFLKYYKHLLEGPADRLAFFNPRHLTAALTVLPITPEILEDLEIGAEDRQIRTSQETIDLMKHFPSFVAEQKEDGSLILKNGISLISQGARLSTREERHAEIMNQIRPLLQSIRLIQELSPQDAEPVLSELNQLSVEYPEFPALFEVLKQEISDRVAADLTRNPLLISNGNTFDDSTRQRIFSVNELEIQNQSRIIDKELLPKWLGIHVNANGGIDWDDSRNSNKQSVAIDVERFRQLQVNASNLQMGHQGHVYGYKIEIERIKRYILDALNIQDRPTPFGVKFKGEQGVNIFDGNHRSYLMAEQYQLTPDEDQSLDDAVFPVFVVELLAPGRGDIRPNAKLRYIYEAYSSNSKLSTYQFTAAPLEDDGRYYFHHLKWQADAMTRVIFDSAIPNFSATAIVTFLKQFQSTVQDAEELEQYNIPDIVKAIAALPITSSVQRDYIETSIDNMEVLAPGPVFDIARTLTDLIDTSDQGEIVFKNGLKLRLSGARLVTNSQNSIVHIEPKEGLVHFDEVQAMLRQLNLPAEKTAVFIGVGNPNTRYGTAMGEYENPSPLIRWEFHLLNAGLSVEIYEPGYLSEWYQKTDSALGKYKSGMNAYGSYIDTDSQKDSAGFISASSFFTDGPGNIPDSLKNTAAQKIADTLAVGGYLHLAHYLAVKGEQERSNQWKNVIEAHFSTENKRLVLAAQGSEDPETPLAHAWELYRVESASRLSSDGEWVLGERWNASAFELLATLNHPNLPKVRKEGEVWKYQWIEGSTLRDLVSKAGADVYYAGHSDTTTIPELANQALQQFADRIFEISNGIKELSEHGYQYSDLNSGNVVISNTSNRPVLIDFEYRDKEDSISAELMYLIEDIIFTYIEFAGGAGYGVENQIERIRISNTEVFYKHMHTAELMAYLFGKEHALSRIAQRLQQSEDVSLDELREALNDLTFKETAARLTTEFQGEWKTPRKKWNTDAMRLLSGINHPNLVRVREVDGVYQYKTVKGRALASIVEEAGALAKERFGSDKRSDQVLQYVAAIEVLEKFNPYFFQVLDGLEQLNQKGFLNDDNHSENVIIDDDTGQAVVIDFKGESSLSGSVEEVVLLLEDLIFTYFDHAGIPGFARVSLGRALVLSNRKELVVQRDTALLFEHLFGNQSELARLVRRAEKEPVDTNMFKQAVIQEIETAKGARLVPSWSEKINRFLIGVIAVLGSQIATAGEVVKVPIDRNLNESVAVFQLEAEGSDSIIFSEVSDFGFGKEKPDSREDRGVKIQDAKAENSLRVGLDVLTSNRTVVSARDSATNRALFNQAIQAIPRIDSRPVVAIVDLTPFKNITENDPRYDLMLNVFIKTFLRDGHYLRFEGASATRLKKTYELAKNLVEKLKVDGGATRILQNEDPNPKDAFEVVLRQQASDVKEKITRDRVFVAIGAIPDDPHALPELGSTALLMKAIGESVRFKDEIDTIDSDTIHSGLISAVNSLYDTDKTLGLSEVIWVLSADVRGDEFVIGMVRVDNVIMAIRMQNRQVDIMA